MANKNTLEGQIGVEIMFFQKMAYSGQKRLKEQRITSMLPFIHFFIYFVLTPVGIYCEVK